MKGGGLRPERQSNPTKIPLRHQSFRGKRSDTSRCETGSSVFRVWHQQRRSMKEEERSSGARRWTLSGRVEEPNSC